ncbi:MAG: WD40 repeat domain-containing protein [bacterium]
MDDPQRHIAPLFIPLREVGKESSFEKIITNHFYSKELDYPNMSCYNHMFNHGEILIFFDGFDEMADNVQWEVTQRNFKKLIHAAEGKGKIVITCRTHYFKDREEQIKVIDHDSSLSSEIETELYRELRRQPRAEVVYLENFSEEQVRSYLKKARPDTADKDWKMIKDVFDLENLAHCPMLLDMIINSPDKLKKHGSITVANLYNVYVELWIDHVEKGRKYKILNRDSWKKLMWELSWKMWNEEKNACHNTELVSFVEKLEVTDNKPIIIGDKSAEEITAVMRSATFISRDKYDYYSFMHQSFMEFFLASKIFDILQYNNIDMARQILNTRRFDRKTIYFLTSLDQNQQIWKPLSKILMGEYVSNISENALHILYWNRRIKCNMEKEITNSDKLKEDMAHFIPNGANLQNAKLQKIILEGIVLHNADLSGADLTMANLNRGSFKGSIFQKAIFKESRCMKSNFSNCDFRNVRFIRSSFDESDFSLVDLRGASDEKTCFIGANWTDAKGMILELTRTSIEIKELKRMRKSFKPVVQRGHSQDLNCVEFNPEGTLLAACGRDGVVFLWCLSDRRLILTLEGHRDFVRSLNFSRDGKMLVSGSEDQTIRLWDVYSGETIKVFEGHTGWIMSVNFSPDGKMLASACEDNTIMLWSVPSLKPLKSLTGHKGPVREVNFSFNGKTLASGSADNTIRLWDISTGKTIRILNKHDGWVRSVKFSPTKEKILASGSSDNTVRLWDVDSGQNLHNFEGHRHWVRSVNFSHDGTTLASGSEDRTIRLWGYKVPYC